MREQVERELKLIPPAGFDLSSELRGVSLPDRAFVSTYHDTQDLRLARNGVTFRHRSEEGSRLWQLKLPRGAARIELEEAGPPARPPATMLGLLPAYLRGAELTRVARLKTWRKSLRIDGAEVVDDSVAVLDGQRVTARFRELEVELADGDERTLRRLEKALRRAGATAPRSFEPKLFRVLELAYPVESELPSAATPLEALGSALVEQYRRLLAHDPGARLGVDAEDVHQMRVATRRARAFLRVARRFVDATWAAELREELGWLGSALGPVRDLDVLLEHLRSDVAGLGADAEKLRDFIESIEREYEFARVAALATLDDDRYLRLLDRLEVSGDPPSAADGPPTTLASVWSKEFARLRRTFGPLDDTSSDAELHAARIRVKRARYAAELARHELGRPGDRFVSAARRLQDVLGEHQDACVATDRIDAWISAAASSSEAERLLVLEAEKRARARREWPDAWKKLERRGRSARRKS
jgi:CHAD domain-containing protein